MCGICGIVSSTLNAEKRNHYVKKMMETLVHRGPDGEGIAIGNNWTFGHRRLAVIDIHTGQQPMWSAEGRYCIVYNGEIYNYVELKSRMSSLGEVFHTSSDTEVLLKMLIRYGEECLPELDGMFSFVFIDTYKYEILACRDAFGIKPLYYNMLDDGSFIFSSEIKAFFEVPEVERSPSKKGIEEYLTMQFCLDDRTLFKGIKKVAPGSMLRFSDGKWEASKWYSISFDMDIYHTEDYFVDTLKELMQKSINLQMRSDVPVGTYLSGGMDSSIVTSLAAKTISSPLSCFTGRFDGIAYDESHYARSVAEFTGSDLHIVEPTPSDFVDWMPRIIYALDEPVAGPGVFPQFLVSNEAKRHVTVCLGGQGADEIFGGYARYLVAYLEQALKGAIYKTQNDARYVLTLETLIPRLSTLERYVPMLKKFFSQGLFESLDKRYFMLVNRAPNLKSVLTDDMLGEIDFKRVFNKYLSIFNRSSQPSSINSMLSFDQQTLLPALLHVEDRASMNVSLESRVPFLSPAIAEFAASLPPTFKFKNGALKNSLRESFNNILPSEVINREDKMGFPVPLTDWMQSGVVRDFVFDILFSKRSQERGIYKKEYLRSLVDSQSKFARDIWGVLCLELWFLTFIDSPPKYNA